MKDDIKSAVEVLKKGGIILYPTDTIWGLGCDATNEKAIEKIYKIKHRQNNKSMIILLDSSDKLSLYVKEVPEIAYELIELTIQPLTIIYPQAINLAPSIIAEDGSMGIRIVRDEFCKQLIKILNKPIVSTSANISGRPFPEIFDDIEEEIIKSVDYVVKWRQNDKVSKSPSGIIKLGLNNEVEIIRE